MFDRERETHTDAHTNGMSNINRTERRRPLRDTERNLPHLLLCVCASSIYKRIKMTSILLFFFSLSLFSFGGYFYCFPKRKKKKMNPATVKERERNRQHSIWACYVHDSAPWPLILLPCPPPPPTTTTPPTFLEEWCYSKPNKTKKNIYISSLFSSRQSSYLIHTHTHYKAIINGI